VPDEYRPWAAAALTAPDFPARRRRALLLVQVPLVVLPQLLLALYLRSWFNAGAVVVMVMVMVGVVRLLPDGWAGPEHDRLLAHHGVTRDGRLVEPVSLWQTSGMSPATMGLVAVHALVLGAGTVVVGDHLVSPDRCRVAPAAHVAAVEAALGRTQVQGGPPTEPLFTGARLRDPRQVRTQLDGVSYLSARIDGAPAAGAQLPVWRVIEPGGAFPIDVLNVSAESDGARALTPTLGYSTNDPPDPAREQVRECVRDARS
jgi:hypothetical protein